jgi:hypothetical protein
MRISSANQAIDALGGTAEVARLFDLDPRVVSNWRSRGLPPDTYAVMAPALIAQGHEFSPLLFGQKLHAAAYANDNSRRRKADASPPP